MMTIVLPSPLLLLSLHSIQVAAQEKDTRNKILSVYSGCSAIYFK